MSIPLFERFPELYTNIAWIKLGNYPTPIQRLKNIEKIYGFKNIYIKRDDLSSDKYGGNKVRKLEFVLAKAKEDGIETIVTPGGLGTHHGLATAIFGNESGFKVALLLMDQPVNEHVKQNLLADYYYNAELVRCGSSTLTALHYGIFQRLKRRNTFFLPAGGSTPYGVLGYVNAAMEIKKQVEMEDIPEPDYIFVATGTAGTLSGLILGAQIAGLKSKIIGVRVVPTIMTRESTVRKLYKKALSIMVKNDSTMAKTSLAPPEFEILHDFFGKGYGCATESCLKCIDIVKEQESIQLEATYTAKAFDGMVCYLEKKKLHDSTAMFIDTYSSADLSTVTNTVSWKDLPSSLHDVFES